MPYVALSSSEGSCGHSHDTIEDARHCIDRILRAQRGPEAGSSLTVQFVPDVLASPAPGTEIRASWAHSLGCWRVQTKSGASEPYRTSCMVDALRLKDPTVFGSVRSLAITGTVAGPQDFAELVTMSGGRIQMVIPQTPFGT